MHCGCCSNPRAARKSSGKNHGGGATPRERRPYVGENGGPESSEYDSDTGDYEKAAFERRPIHSGVNFGNVSVQLSVEFANLGYQADWCDFAR